MPKRKDENEIAFDVLQEIMRRDAARDGVTQEPPHEPEKVPYRVEAGRKGGLKGGKTRAAKLGVKQRKEIAKKAAHTRWNKLKNNTA
jgi:hypothetical protein